MHPPTPPVACTLSDPEKRVREATLISTFKSAVIESEELDEGYAFRLPADQKSIALVAELIVAERECCPFLSFQMTAEANMGAVSFRIIGPEGTKEFLKSLLV